MPSVEDVYRRLFPLVRAKCSRLLGVAQAEEIAQEAFVRLWKEDIADRTPAEISAWVYTTSTRLAIDAIRRGRVADRAPPLAVAPASDAEARLTLIDLVARAPEQQLLAAMLHRVDGLSQGEVAAAMSLSDRTIRRLIDRFDAAFGGTP